MSWYGNRHPQFISASTEDRLEEKLKNLTIGIDEKLEIISIYPRGSKIVCWYFLDIRKKAEVPPALRGDGKKVIKKGQKKSG